MSRLIEGEVGYIVFNMEENQRQAMDTRGREPDGPRAKGGTRARQPARTRVARIRGFRAPGFRARSARQSSMRMPTFSVTCQWIT